MKATSYIQGINPMLNLTEAEITKWLTENGITALVENSTRRIGVVTLAQCVVFANEDDMRKFYLEFLEPRRAAIFVN